MGSIIQAVIQHSLSAKEILSFSESFNSPQFIDDKGTKLKWSAPDMHVSFLEKYWTLTPGHFIKTPWGVEDLALLENEKLSLHFYTNKVVALDTHLKANLYKQNPKIKSEFDLMAKHIALQMNAVESIVIEDWYFDNAFEVDAHLTIQIIRRKFRNKNLPYFTIDLRL